jgi:probable addiction module antidote protein
MEKIKTRKWDMAEHIKDKEDVIAYLEAAFEENDTELILSVFNDIARSKGMTKIAKELKLSRRGLYQSLAPDGNPSFKTVLKLIDVLGLQIKLASKSLPAKAKAVAR